MRNIIIIILHCIFFIQHIIFVSTFAEENRLYLYSWKLDSCYLVFFLIIIYIFYIYVSEMKAF